MKKTRLKLELPTLKTREDAEAAMTDLSALVNSQRRVLSDRDAAVLVIHQRVEAPLAELEARIKAQTDALRAWAESNPDQFPKGRKSLDMVSGTLGFRTGTPALKLLSRAFTWEKVLDLIRHSWTGYIRTKEEVAKDTILNGVAAGALRPDDLRTIGLKVEQAESFFIEPKLTELPTRHTQEAA